MVRAKRTSGPRELPTILAQEFNKLRAVVENLILGDVLLQATVLSIGSTPTNVATTAFKYQIEGIRAAKAAVAAGTAFTATTHDIAADAEAVQEAIYVLSVASGGAITITKGATADEGEAEAPATPANEVKIGEVLIQVAAGATSFDATTDALNEAHLTVTYTPEPAITTDAEDIDTY